jgi:hypothetical protein
MANPFVEELGTDIEGAGATRTRSALNLENGLGLLDDFDHANLQMALDERTSMSKGDEHFCPSVGIHKHSYKNRSRPLSRWSPLCATLAT